MKKSTKLSDHEATKLAERGYSFSLARRPEKKYIIESQKSIDKRRENEETKAEAERVITRKALTKEQEAFERD